MKIYMKTYSKIKKCILISYHQLPIKENHDAVTVHDGVQSMGNSDNSALSKICSDSLLNYCIGPKCSKFLIDCH